MKSFNEFKQAEALSEAVTVKLNKSWVVANSDMADVENWVFDLSYDGKKIGVAKYNDYFGDVIADIGNRSVTLNNYNKSSFKNNTNSIEKYISTAIVNYFKSKTGQKHFITLQRQGFFPTDIQSLTEASDKRMDALNKFSKEFETLTKNSKKFLSAFKGTNIEGNVEYIVDDLFNKIDYELSVIAKHIE